MSAQFGLGAVLSVSTGKGCATEAEIHTLLEHLLNEPVSWPFGAVPALVRGQVVLLARLPWLAAIELPGHIHSAADVYRWLDLLVQAGLPPTITL